MYRAFLAYLYSVACNLFEVYKGYDPLSPTFLPLRLEPDLNQEFTGANEFLVRIAKNLTEDLVDSERWTHANCRNRMYTLATHLNHWELKEGTPLDNKLRTHKDRFFKSLAWDNYSRDLLEAPGNPLGYNSRSLDQGPFFLQPFTGARE